MPKLADRVKETTTTTGTGAISLGGAAAGYRAFSAAFATGDTVYYCIEGGAEWEVGIGTLTSGSPWTMARTTVLASSNAGAAVSFSAGGKNVFCTAAAASFPEVGTVMDSAIAPGTGAWLACDGSIYDDSAYPLLAPMMPNKFADGITWTARSLPSSQAWYSVTYGNGVFVAVVNGAAVAATSPDGITWTARTLPSSQTWSSVTYGNGVFVAVTNSSAVAATSPDGITWTARSLPSSQAWPSVTFGNGVFVAVANGAAVAALCVGDSTKFVVPTIASRASNIHPRIRAA